MQLPLLITIPHSGMAVPEEIGDRIFISRNDIYNESDALTDSIYDFHLASAIITTEIARAFVDVNRAPDDLPPGNPGGAVKTMTSHRAPVYAPDSFPDAPLIERLIQKYHTPFHERIRASLTGHIRIGLDCHSMSSCAPPISRHHGKARPAICIGNANGRSASHDMTALLAACFREVFRLSESDVAINNPFAGGYITRSYGKSIAWFLIEINKNLYLTDPRDPYTADGDRLAHLNMMFKKTITLFFERI